MQRLFGPPGTGKTTTLLNLVDKALADGVPSTQIAFFAFTRKAATEAKELSQANNMLHVQSGTDNIIVLFKFAQQG